MKWLVELFDTVIKPIEVKLLSIEKVTDLVTRTQFHVTFEIRVFLNTRRMRFATIGLVEAEQAFSLEELTEIIKVTDFEKYIESNMIHREAGNFNYSYMHNGNLLIVNYTTF